MPLSEEILERLFDEARRSPRIAGGFRPPEEFAEEYFRKDYCPPDTFYLDARENVPEIIGDIHTLRAELEKARTKITEILAVTLMMYRNARRDTEEGEEFASHLFALMKQIRSLAACPPKEKP